MKKAKNLVCGMSVILVLSSCGSTGARYYDSALNDRNRAPASVSLPPALDKDTSSIDSVHNQSQADYLFIKSEMESYSGRSSETIDLLKSALIFDADSATLMQKLSVEYYKSGQLPEALSWAEKAYVLQPQKREVALLYAGLLTTTKNFKQAELVYKELAQQNPKDTEIKLYLGAVYTELRRYSQAIKTFKSITTAKGESKHLAHYYLARLYSEISPERTSRVTVELEKAIELKPDFFEAVAMMGQYVEKLKGPKAAMAYYEKIQKTHPQVKLAEVLSQYYISVSEYDKAYEQLSVIDENTEDAIQVKLKMALILIDKKVYDKAIEKLNEILVIAPESDKVRFYLSAVFEEQKDYKAAVENYLKIQKDSSYYEEARVHAAFVMKQTGQLDMGIALLNEVIETKTESVQTYVFLSQLHEEKKDMKASLDTLVKATQKFAHNSQVHYYLGVLQDKMNLKDDMIATMTKVVDLEPDHSQALNYLAYTWAESGINLEKAESYARLAAQKEKDDAFILDTLGWVLYKKGDYKKAAEVLEKAHKILPEAAIISEHLGDTYIKLNKIEKARAQFLKAEAAELDATRKNEISQKISRLETTPTVPRTPSSVLESSNKSTSP